MNQEKGDLKVLSLTSLSIHNLNRGLNYSGHVQLKKLFFKEKIEKKLSFCARGHRLHLALSLPPSRAQHHRRYQRAHRRERRKRRVLLVSPPRRRQQVQVQLHIVEEANFFTLQFFVFQKKIATTTTTTSIYHQFFIKGTKYEKNVVFRQLKFELRKDSNERMCEKVDFTSSVQRICFFFSPFT